MAAMEKELTMLDKEVSIVDKEISASEKETPITEEAVTPASDHSSTKESVKKPEDGGSDVYFMTGAKLHILIFVLSIACLLMALDMSILVTAIPLITEKFQSTADIAWYMSAYSLTLCAFQPLGGKLYANFSLKWTFMAFFLVFEIGSAISGGATSSNMLIVGRAIAGSGAAGLMSGTLSIVAVVVELRLRALYTGFLSSMFGIALICGPLIGGAFTENVSWRWVFYINLPLGGIIIPVIIFMLNPPTRAVEHETVKSRVKKLDLLGAAVFIPAIIMILMPLQWGGITYPWNSGRIIGLFVGGGIVLVLFAIYQWYRGDMAMIPPAIMTERTVLLASIAAMWGMGAQALLGLWMPEWFQVIKGRSPVGSGVNLLPAMLAQSLTAVIGGGLTSAFGYYNPWMLLGTALLSIGSGLFTTFEVDTGSAKWIGYQVIFGSGGGLFLTAPMVAVQSVLSPADTPIGLSTVTFFQMFGGALFIALSQTIFNEQLLKELAKNVPEVNIGLLLAAGTSGIRKVASAEQLPGIIQSYNVALMDTFYLAAGITAASFFTALWLPWINVKGKNLAAGAAV